ncbi:hypothetical protein CAter282_3079 [Collimonas arenae]|uniref:Uncharacterized protein n=1 Tax=Collimonas arenae TaxID=279058 RepID=A0A127QL48_9BURK|nr:hypothetical protein CAter282_3079 [Collimonas arenae]
MYKQRADGRFCFIEALAAKQQLNFVDLLGGRPGADGDGPLLALRGIS